MPEARPLLRDLVVVLPGIMGSTLAKDGKLVWAPSSGAAIEAIRTFGRSITSLKLPDQVGDECPNDGVEPRDVMPDLHILPWIWSANIGYEVLIRWLRTEVGLNSAPSEAGERLAGLVVVPYDWRLSNRFNGRRLKRIVEPALERWRSQSGGYGDAKLIFVCHSMGGLIAKWYIEMESGAELTAKLITMGTPYRGSLTALHNLVTGVKVGAWPLKFNLTEFARSLPSLYQLLPEYACIESPRGLLKTTETEIPELVMNMVEDGMRFHEELDSATAKRDPDAYALHPIVGTRQRTGTTARLVNREIEVIDTIEGNDEGGDHTVPRLAATPKDVLPDSSTIRWPAEKHGALQSNAAVLEEIHGVLSANPVRHRGSKGTELRVDVEEIVRSGEPLDIKAESEDRLLLQATVIDERGKNIATTLLYPAEGINRGTVTDLAPGAYRVVVGGVGPSAPLVAKVTSTVLVWDEGPE